MSGLGTEDSDHWGRRKAVAQMAQNIADEVAASLARLPSTLAPALRLCRRPDFALAERLIRTMRAYEDHQDRLVELKHFYQRMAGRLGTPWPPIPRRP